MMMVCIYHMVSEKKPFSPTDYEELMEPQNHVERVVLNENNVFASGISNFPHAIASNNSSHSPTSILSFLTNPYYILGIELYV